MQATEGSLSGKKRCCRRSLYEYLTYQYVLGLTEDALRALVDLFINILGVVVLHEWSYTDCALLVWAVHGMLGQGPLKEWMLEVQNKRFRNVYETDQIVLENLCPAYLSVRMCSISWWCTSEALAIQSHCAHLHEVSRHVDAMTLIN